MIKNNYPGKFIVFEGLDGSGQSTQADLLRNFLIEKGLKVVLTKEPTLDSEAGKKIRQVLDKMFEVSPRTLQELFTQDRKEHLENLIVPALKEGKTVISDRYFFSTFAYGVYSGLDLERLKKINDEFLIPDLTFILKVNPETCITRIEKRGVNKTLFEEAAKLAKIWETYAILPNHIENAYIIDGEKSVDEVFLQVKLLIRSKLNIKEE